jgi:NAD(P)-dependent dehydrogenase (short-subunit alcohol dehydrogenase family)/acyl carrier protein
MDGHSYALFQETMRQFLSTQQTVLAQLFGGGQPQASVAASSAQKIPAQPHYPEPAARFAPAVNHAAPVVQPAAVSVESAPAAESPAASDTVSATVENSISATTVAAEGAKLTATELQSRLAAVVADRTGYPAEMLSLDINLEGELGIDSIKRVEIIAAFRRDVLPEMLEPPAEFMERLAGAKTMRQIVDVVSEMSGATNVDFSQPAPESSVISAAAALDPDDLLTTLLRVVADRTGYPAEMLDLDINLEGELGIDSIKRVEIIAAFRREVLPEMLEPPAQFMEQLAGAKTMRAIIEVVVAMSGSPAAEESSPVSPALASRAGTSASSLAIDPSQLEPTLVRIVADRTGYPAEMLSGEVNLESELGIDSIKRVEIIAAFRREVRPDLVEAPPELMERLAGAKTISAILTCFTEPVRRNAATDIPAASLSEPRVAATNEPNASIADIELCDADACPRCIADIVDAPIAHVEELRPGAVIVIESEATAAHEFVRGLEASKHRVERLSSADLRDAKSAREAVARIRRSAMTISAVAHLAPLEGVPAWPSSDTSLWNDRFDHEVRGLLFLLQALEPELSSTSGGKIRILSASLGGGDFTTGEAADSASSEASHPWRGGLAGLLKVAACEWPQHAFRAVDFMEQPSAEILLQELTASGPVEIGYRNGRRLQIQTRRVELPRPKLDQAPISAKSTVLVTGGAKGITAAVVAELAKSVPASFILLGRSALTSNDESPATAGLSTDMDLRKAIIAELRARGGDCTPAIVEGRLTELKSNREVHRNLAAITAAGGKVEYIPCDIRDEDNLIQVLADVQSRHGAIHGIIHGAGVIDDRHIKDKTAESFDRVVRTKIDPILTLLENIDRNALQLVALFSSTSGFFGNSGQCDYAAANEVLNRIACRLRSTWHGKVVSFNWGPWAGAGMVTPEVAAKMRAGGIDLIPLSAGCAAACREMLNSEPTSPRVIMGRGPWLQDEQLRAGMDFSAYGTLLGGPLEVLPGGGFVARVVLDRTSRYLHDHRIEGKAVLPVAMAVGLMAEAARLKHPEWHVAAVENVRMLSGITIEHDTREILLRVEPLSGDQQSRRWLVSIRPVEMPQRILYDAHVELASTPPVAPIANFPDPIEAALEATASEAYDRWLFHGPSYKVIQAFAGADERGIDAIVRPGDDGASADGVLDHVVIDAAPQLAMIWSRALFDVAVLPNRISSYRVYEPIGAGEVEMKLRIRPGNDRQVYNADVWIVRDGRLIAHMEGLEGAGSPQLNRIAVQL